MYRSVIAIALSAAMLMSCSSGSKIQVSRLEENFANPPSEARPQVWWHWMNGNITKDGILKDITWMKNSGIGGFHHFDAALDIKPIVDKRLIYMDEGWKDAFRYAIDVADSLDMSVTVASSPGWSSTGGPWVTPEDAMKKIVWRKVVVDGGRHVSLTLPEGYSASGNFLNNPNGAGKDCWYKDIAVLAVKLPEDYSTLEEMGASLTSDGEASLADLTDDDMLTGTAASWIVCSFDTPKTICSATVSDQRDRSWWRDEPADTSAVLEASDDGVAFREIARIPSNTVHYQTVSFPAVTAKSFRLSYPSKTRINEFSLSPIGQVMMAPDKAAFASPFDLNHFRTPSFRGCDAPVDLTGCFKDGVLDWEAPAGRWMIFRMGASLTGKQNHPAPPEATGLEVDKLDPDAWTAYFRHYLDMYREASDGKIGQKGIQYLLNDSYEAQAQNWTPRLAEFFKEQNGYDLLPWLPALAGVVIGDSEQTERFLWDFRMTLGKLFSDNYSRLDGIVSEYGMKGRYTEAHENGKVFVSDGMDIKRTATIPMSATWVPYRIPWGCQNEMADADVRESASVAHLYGQNLVACESHASPGYNKRAYTFCPENLKPVIDREFAGGVNRVVIHESAHQPCDDKVPGLGLQIYGQWFNRHETWAHLAGCWVDYMARTSYLLQQGSFKGDFLVYYGEDSNICSEYGITAPEVPAGYGFDYINPSCLLELKVRDGKLIAPSGNTYEVLWLGRNVDIMSVKVLRKLAELADRGARIAGAAPTIMASNKDSKEEFDSLVSEIWGSGRANVTATPEDAIGSVAKDWDAPEGLAFVHRNLGDSQIYWVSNTTGDPMDAVVSFRVSGLEPRLWHAETGLVEDVSYKMEGGRTDVSLEMLPHDAVFVVFSGKTDQTVRTLPAVTETVIASVEGPWNVRFQENRGAPEEAVFENLVSLPESEDDGIRYFSGTAEYSKTIMAPSAQGRVILDLGTVKNLAEVLVNGERVAVLWKAPFRCDITDALREGENSLVVRVTNLWVNRIIGDEQPGATRYTLTPHKFYSASDALLPSGLIGPVRLLQRN